MTARKGMFSLVVSALIVAAALFASAPRALAQAWGMSSLMQPPVTSEDIGRLIEIIEADEEQEAVMRDLFQTLMQKHETASEQFREIMQAAQQEAQRDPSAMRDMFKKMHEFMGYTKGLKESLFEDISLVLTPEQAEQWPRFERYHRRQHVLDDNQAFISGSRVDLVGLVGDVVEDESALEEPETADLLRRYEVELDRALKAKEELGERQFTEMVEAFADGGNWMDMMPMWEKMLEEGRENQTEIRDVNERYLRLIGLRVESAGGTDLEAEYNQRAMPEVYGENYVDSAFETAMGLEDLTDEQEEQIAGLLEAYEREAQAIRDKWAEAVVEWQERVTMTDMFGGAKAGGSEGATQRSAKKELDGRYYEQVRAILTEDQRQQLPEREKDWRASGGFGG